MLADLTTRRFHATLLTKPVEPSQLAAAVRAGLRYWQGRRENRRLMAQLEAAHAESERRREEAEEARRRYHDLVQGIDLVVWEADAATGRFTFVSRRAEEFFGQPAERWLAEPGLWLDRIVPEDREYAAVCVEAWPRATVATSSWNTGRSRATAGRSGSARPSASPATPRAARSACAG